MEIEVRKQYKTIKPFLAKDLPDLVVLTGENGTGKTQLLEYLYYGTRLDDSGDMAMSPNNENLFHDMPEVERNVALSGEVLLVLPCEVRLDGNRLRNAVYRGVQAPTVDVGGKYNLDSLYAGGENIAQKHLFYKTHSVLKNIEEKTPEELSNQFNAMLGFKRGKPHVDVTFPEFNSADIDVIKRIESEFPTPDYSKDPFYYVAFQPSPPGNVFTANLKFLYFQYWARLQAGLKVGLAPWKAFNDIGEMLNFKFELDEPKIEEKRFDVRLRDKERKVFISPDSLSSGEKVIFSLFVAMYTTHSNEQLPGLILFDEPDAYLHPSLCSTMLKVIREVFIKEHHIKVIMTTHSPTTVAMLPEISLFCMKDGKMSKVTKQAAILSLTEGLNTISVYYENVKQVFVEANNDNTYLTNVYHLAMTAGKLIKDVNLRFINVREDGDGGCDTVRRIVNELTGADNKTVFAIIDYDGKNVRSDRIKILGNGGRYSIDNYLVDPLALSLLYLEESSEREKVGFDAHDSIVGYGGKSLLERQAICDNIIAHIEAKVPVDLRTGIDQLMYKTMGGDEYHIPRWYTTMQGHMLVKYVREAAPFLKKYKDKELFKKVIESYGNYPEIIPLEIVNTLIEIQRS